MHATATAMVKSIWQAYFRPPGAREGEEEAPAAAEVEEDENEEEGEDDVAEDALAEAGDKGKSKARPGISSGAAACETGVFLGAKRACHVRWHKHPPGRSTTAHAPPLLQAKKSGSAKKAPAKKLTWVGKEARAEGGDRFYAQVKVSACCRVRCVGGVCGRWCGCMGGVCVCGWVGGGGGGGGYTATKEPTCRVWPPLFTPPPTHPPHPPLTHSPHNSGRRRRGGAG